MLIGVGHRNVLHVIVGLIRNWLNMFFCCTSYDSQGQILVNYLKQVILLDTFEAFLGSSIFDKAVFCLGCKQGMLVNDECGFWYKRIGDFLFTVLEERKKHDIVADQKWAQLDEPTSECEANGTECYGG